MQDIFANNYKTHKQCYDAMKAVLETGEEVAFNFPSIESLLGFVRFVNELNGKNPTVLPDYYGQVYPVWSAESEQIANVTCGELKTFTPNLFPAGLYFSSTSDIASFSEDFAKSQVSPNIINAFVDEKGKKIVANNEQKRVPKKVWKMLAYIVALALIMLVPKIISNTSSSNTEDYFEQSTGNSIWDGTWKFGDSWTIKLNSKTDEAIVNGKSCFWQDGGDYAVIGVDKTSVLYMRKDGHLYTGDNKGNVSVDFGFSLKKQ